MSTKPISDASFQSDVIGAEGPVLVDTFHPSQQNTFTGKLKPRDLDRVFQKVLALLGEGEGHQAGRPRGR